MSFACSLGGAAVSPYGPGVTGGHRTLSQRMNDGRQARASARSSTIWRDSRDSSSGWSSRMPLNAASMRAARRAARSPAPERSRWATISAIQTSLEARTDVGVGLAAEQSERGRLDVEALAAQQLRHLERLPEVEHRLAHRRRRGQCLDRLHRAIARRRQHRRDEGVLRAEVVDQHPVARAQLGGQGPQAQPDQPVLEGVVGGLLGQLVSFAHCVKCSICYSGYVAPATDVEEVSPCPSPPVSSWWPSPSKSSPPPSLPKAEGFTESGVERRRRRGLRLLHLAADAGRPRHPGLHRLRRVVRARHGGRSPSSASCSSTKASTCSRSPASRWSSPAWCCSTSTSHADA